MSNLAFDTHKFVTDLSKTGMDTSVAEVLANHYASVLNDRIATKDDLNALRTELKGEMAALRGEMSELKGEMTALEERLTARLVRPTDCRAGHLRHSRLADGFSSALKNFEATRV